MSASASAAAPILCRLPDEHDRSHYAFGECYAFAVALRRLHPQLSLMVLCYGEPEDELCERHVMAHDGQWAYDCHGATPLAQALASAPVVETGCEEYDVSEMLCAQHDEQQAQEAERLLRLVVGEKA